jgi:hypothetical protein
MKPVLPAVTYTVERKHGSCRSCDRLAAGPQHYPLALFMCHQELDRVRTNHNLNLGSQPSTVAPNNQQNMPGEHSFMANSGPAAPQPLAAQPSIGTP